jgi:hypothetical protein
LSFKKTLVSEKSYKIASQNIQFGWQSEKLKQNGVKKII